ncbi:MAG: hypothetical protein OWQ48_00145 [Desulfurococcus sp.]|nr:hypothetical protein [Desulfurococcus sp.]
MSPPEPREADSKPFSLKYLAVSRASVDLPDPSAPEKTEDELARH